jgi:lysocardiolipin and lysophospholipid acyltransferase
LTFCTNNFSSKSEVMLSFRDAELMKKCVKAKEFGALPELSFDPSAIIISNHQIYSDWFFLWYLAYLNNISQHFFIVMKKSLLRLPILGQGMRNYSFVFLSRNWEKDKEYMNQQFAHIKTLNRKFWMLIFPEGTNISHNNKKISHKYAEKAHLPKNECVLLPRVKGLYVAAKQLYPNTTKILDFSIGYSDHGKDDMAQDVFTLWRIYIEGVSPKRISILVDEHDLQKQVPGLYNEEFDEETQMDCLGQWINGVWEVKEKDMEHYYEKGEFDVPEGNSLVFPLELKSNWEVIGVYGPTLAITVAVLALILLWK